METMRTSPNAKSTKRLEEVLEAMRDKKNDFEAAQEVLVEMLEENPLKHEEYFTQIYNAYLKHIAIMDMAMAKDTIPCLLYTSPSPRDGLLSRMPSSA